MKLSTLLLAALIVSTFSTVHAATVYTIPYENDFNSQGLTYSNTAASSQWDVNEGSYIYTTSNSSYAPATASVQISNATALSTFTVETQFTINSFANVNANGETVGFGILGETSDFIGTSASTEYYLADYTVASPGSGLGTLRILGLPNGPMPGFTATNTNIQLSGTAANQAIFEDITYTLRFTGTYAVDGTLHMTLSLWDATGTTQFGDYATASDTTPLTGEYFGFRNRIGISGGTFSTSFDNFSITTAAIPEPTSASLWLTGLAVLGLARRRKSANLLH